MAVSPFQMVGRKYIILQSQRLVHQIDPKGFCLAPTEPLLCKFADGGQKKRQNQNKYIQNGRAWHREGEVRLVSSHFNLLKFMCV